MMNKIICMKTNKVFVGDICYALNEDIYRDIWGEQMDYEDGVIEFEGEPVAIVGRTHHGDGEYYGEAQYCVDAGVIGVTDLNYRDPNPYAVDERLDYLGKIVNIPSGVAKISFEVDDGDFSIKIYDDKELVFQDDIYTGWVDDDDEDWEE